MFVESSLEVSTVISAIGSPTLLCILGSRLCFNLKEAAEHGVNVGTNWSSHFQGTTRIGKSEDEGE